MNRTIIYDSNKSNKTAKDETTTRVINAVNSANAKSNNDFTRPSHYCYSSIEPKEAIRAWGLNFNLGNVIKYVVRAGKKDDILTDLQKAKTYLDFEIDAIVKERLTNENN